MDHALITDLTGIYGKELVQFLIGSHIPDRIQVINVNL